MASKAQTQTEKEPTEEQAELQKASSLIMTGAIDVLLTECRSGILMAVRKRVEAEQQDDPDSADQAAVQTDTINFLVRLEQWLEDRKT